jgi:hypothetical protein
MSTTLTNGLKLPDKGSVDWYSDMQNNYTILDNSVGTIAEHTTALAGKAPAVHTHVKADITDLFNSANVWTGNQTYSGVLTLSSSSDVAEQFKQKLPKDVSTSNDAMARVNTLVDLAGHYVVAETLGHWANYVSKSVTLKYKNDSTKQGTIDLRLYSDGSGLFYPQSPFECSLGNSSNQWASVYAQSYYYNGVAWGLDKSNHWKETQVIHQGEAVDIVNNPSAERVGKSLYFMDASRFWAQYIPIWGTDGSFRMELGISNYTTTGSQGYWTVANRISKNFGTLDFYTTHGNANLGTSTNKWKTLNGINPGALSLPDTLGTSGTENVNYFNVIGYLNNTGTLATIPSTATYDGWLYINAKDGADSYIIIDDSPASFGTSVFGNNGLGSQSIGLLCLICPIRKGHAYNVRIKSAGIVSARIYPAQGNV